MLTRKFIIIYNILIFFIISSFDVNAQKIAFISDPHIEDVINNPNLVRSLDSQVKSTRLFNENIFAFRAALDDICSRGIKFVVISGDITDDGQILNQQAAKNLLDYYESQAGISFFVTPGNHDPASPFGKHSIRNDFLNSDGSEHIIVSDSSLYSNSVRVIPELYSVGHKEMVDCYANFGYMPREEYLYWETPFSNYTYENYSFDEAINTSSIDKRVFQYSDSLYAYDTSYLVEPVKDLWLLSIDCGVYLYDNKTQKYLNSGVGYNNTLLYKPYIVPWVAEVVKRANILGKKVIAFSHFPLLDCNDGASEVLGNSWGKNKFDIERMPSNDISDAMLKAGIRLHFAGHMHIKDVAKCEKDGNVMYNIQIPSLATCIPAYNILTLNGDSANLETIIVDKVEGFDTFYNEYRKEYEYTKSIGKEPIWNFDVLKSRDYKEFCDYQFRDLVRNRFAVKDLPKLLQEEMLPCNGMQLLKKISNSVKCKKSMKKWNGEDLLIDFYRLHYSGSFALDYIPKERLEGYYVLFDSVEKSDKNTEFIKLMKDFVFAFKCFLNDEDETNFELK